MAEPASTPSARKRRVQAPGASGDDEPPATPPRKEKATKARIREEDIASAWLDILRVITFLLVASCGLSYVISGGESMFWGMKNKPKYLRPEWWKKQMEGPVALTLDELAAYDGTDESRPIYLAINGTIYDVTPGRRIYGPGGSYHWFAGCDASRAYVTGCFAEDRTADMRGVEEMYLPLEDPHHDSYWTSQELAAMRKQERADAKKKVHDALLHWVEFFAKSDKYMEVGKVKREKGWLKTEPRKKLCDVAQQGRVKRKRPDQ